MQLPLLPGEITPETVLTALMRRVGPANGITAADLAEFITGRRNAADERRLRQVIEQLRLEGHAICATPDEGYHLAANADDLDRTCRFLVKRIEATARLVAAMKRVATPDLYGQLGLPIPQEKTE
ncbi:hypothetical protein [Vulcaniibacterium tengchongense]|uniref:Uncharacterized protein n=1 Tax=Vulcaniibacterium tengchongense TaxID=1273429 RepID=A0A3N4VPL4_9GAMM|nr:hypothetical protein [Vulcaniibacterium tengchongense]RPE81819.1 hypothetical protein EDC50_1021 [Vulcaniibacterium tengchongense]